MPTAQSLCPHIIQSNTVEVPSLWVYFQSTMQIALFKRRGWLRRRRRGSGEKRRSEERRGKKGRKGTKAKGKQDGRGEE